MLFYYVRHGDPTYDPDCLTPLGERQAEAVGKRFSVYGLDKIYASSSVRAQQTAQPTCEVLKKEMTVLDWCDEAIAWNELIVHYGDNEKCWGFQYNKAREAFARADVRALGKEFYKHPIFEEEPMFKMSHFKEGLSRIQKETDEFFLSLGYRHDLNQSGFVAERPNNDRIALFAHQGFGLAFLSCLLDIPYNDFCTRFDMGHTGVTVIEFDGKQGELCIPTMLQLSNDSHLYKEGMGTSYQNRIYI